MTEQLASVLSATYGRRGGGHVSMDLRLALAMLCGALVGYAAFKLEVAVTTSGWWHARRHVGQRRVIDCTHCLREWRWRL